MLLRPRCDLPSRPELLLEAPAGGLPFTALLILLCLVLGPTLTAQPAGATADSRAGLPAYEPDANTERSSIPAVYRWDLTPLFSSLDAWRQEYDALGTEIGELESFRGTLDDPQALDECLERYFDLHDRANHLTLYANLQRETAISDDSCQTREQESLALMDELMRRASFIRSELLGLPDDLLARAYDALPRLRRRRPYIVNIRRRRSRILNMEAERVLSLAGDNLWAEIDLNEIPSPLENAFKAILTDIPWPKVHDDEGREVQLTLSNYGRFRASENRAVRKEAVTAFLATLNRFRHALAATLAGQAELDVTYARARHYATAIGAYLDKDALQTAVYDNLINTVHDNLAPLHRYVALRKKLLGVSDLHLYDLYVQLLPAAKAEVPFPQACQTILQALAPLGNDYLAKLGEGLDPRNGWIDLYPSKEKRSGAFSASVYGSHPYVLLNYQNSLDDMSTLAHEFGHALHSDFAMANQPYSSFRYVPFLAEIASTCNEALLSDYLIATAEDPTDKAALLVERMESIRTTIYRQTLFAEFERAVHSFVESGTPVTAGLLAETYGGLIRRYYGPGYSLDENDGLEWAYVPHFYYKYYVFTYATGLSSGITIAQRVRKEGQPAAQAYLDMLRGGCSEPPLELLRKAGVDLTRPDAIRSALLLFDQTLDQLEELLGR